MQVKDKNRSRRSTGLLALVCLFCEIGIAPNIALAGGHANFSLIFTAVVAMTLGGTPGVLCGFVAGLIYDLSSTTPIGLMAALCSCAAYSLGRESRDRLGDDTTLTMMQFTVVTFVVTLVYHIVMLVVDGPASIIDTLMFRTLPTVLLTVIFFIPFVLVLRGRHGGGTPSFGNSMKSGSHYALPKM